jgi:CubicO group peptidase (beta-lactamase class C family)
MLLELVIEKYSGMTYLNYLNQRVLIPLGLNNRVFGGKTIDPLPNEVIYDDTNVGLSDWEPYSDLPFPFIHGRWIFENTWATGGLVTDMEVLPRFTAANSVFRKGGRSPVRSSRTGLLPGSECRAVTLANTTGAIIDFGHCINVAEFEFPLTGKTVAQFNTEVENFVSAYFN